MIISGVVKGHLDKRFALTRKERARIGRLSKGDILAVDVGGNTIISRVLEDYIISLPRRLSLKTGSRIRIKILKHIKPQNGLERPNKPFYGNKADIKYFTPQETICGKDIFVINDKKRMFVWFLHGGGIKLTHINRFVEKEKLFEVVGLLLGDGSTEGVRSIRFTNCQLKPISHFIDIFGDVGLDKNLWKVQIILSRPAKPRCHTVEQCKAFWAKNLKLPKENIKSLSWLRSKGNGSEHGSARIFIDNAILFEIFAVGIIKYCVNNINRVDEKTLQCLIRGILSSEGCLSVVNGVIRRVYVSFDPHSDEKWIFREMFHRLGISTIPLANKRNEFEIRGWKNLLKLFLIDGFKLSDKNNKFVRGFISHRPTMFRYKTLRGFTDGNGMPVETVERLIETN